MTPEMREAIVQIADNRGHQVSTRFSRDRYMANARAAEAPEDRRFWVQWARQSNRTLLLFKRCERVWWASAEDLLKSAPARSQAVSGPEGRPPEKAVSEASLEALRVGSIFLHKERRNLMGLCLRCLVTKVDGQWVRYRSMDVPTDGIWESSFPLSEGSWRVKEVVRG